MHDYLLGTGHIIAFIILSIYQAKNSFHRLARKLENKNIAKIVASLLSSTGVEEFIHSL
jgi:hypothetical protein